MKCSTFAKRVCVLVAGFCMGLLSVQSVGALEIKNGDTTVFFDNFENDTVGLTPTIGAGDIGSVWTHFAREIADTEDLTDVEDDSTSLIAATDPRPGKYLSVANRPGVIDGEIFARFPSQDSGTLVATFAANLYPNGDKGSAMRVAFSQGEAVFDHDEECCEISFRHAAYLVTGSWLAPGILPAQLDDNDVVMAFYDGTSYQVVPGQGGTAVDGACIDCAGKWLTVTLTQDPVIGSEPLYTVNGKILEPVPYGNVKGAIDGIVFGANTKTFAYVDDAILGAAPTLSTNFTWAGGTLGDWNTGTNWQPSSGSPPNSINHTAIFDNTATGPRNVSVMSDVTVNRIEFDHASHSYIVSGSGSVNLENSTMFLPPTPRIAVVNGSHQFQARVGLNNDATVEVSSGSTLEFVNRLNLNSNTLTKSGDGTLLINSSFNTGDGTIINNGGVIAGGGTIGGDVNNDGGTISPGNRVMGNSQAVPEPGALGLLLLAGMSCFFLRWNQARRPN